MEKQYEDIQKVIDNLRKIIVDKGLTQATMASYLDIDASQFSKILNGITHLRVEHLAKIARNLNMSVIDILTYPEKYVPSNQAEDPIKASITIQLDRKKRDKVLQMIFETEDLNFLK